jgi:dihydroorotate dehydrogenase (NAD+) catalytic subunit
MNILDTEFCGIRFKNPLVLASGILGVTGGSMAKAAQSGSGGVTSKSWWLGEHMGHANPVIIADQYAMLNAVGLPDAGIEKSREEIAAFREYCPNTPFIASLVAPSVEEFEELTRHVVEMQPDAIEINISCPNVKSEFGELFDGDCKTAESMTAAVKKHSQGIPVSTKLSPNVKNIGNVAKACEAAGANAITAINTVGPGMRISPELRAPILKNKMGGVSGPAILPIAIRCVYEIYEAVKIPIVGTGGITTGRDAVEMLLAGATLLGVGSAIHYRGQEAFRLINEEIEVFCQKEGVNNIQELVGGAH